MPKKRHTSPRRHPHVRDPAYYGDPGDEGWYPELQVPHRSPLEVEYSDKWKRQVYVEPCDLVIPALKLSVKLDKVEKYFSRFNLVSGMSIHCLTLHRATTKASADNRQRCTLPSGPRGRSCMDVRTSSYSSRAKKTLRLRKRNRCVRRRAHSHWLTKAEGREEVA